MAAKKKKQDRGAGVGAWATGGGAWRGLDRSRQGCGRGCSGDGGESVAWVQRRGGSVAFSRSVETWGGGGCEAVVSSGATRGTRLVTCVAWRRLVASSTPPPTPPSEQDKPGAFRRLEGRDQVPLGVWIHLGARAAASCAPSQREAGAARLRRAATPRAVTPRAPRGQTTGGAAPSVRRHGPRHSTRLSHAHTHARTHAHECGRLRGAGVQEAEPGGGGAAVALPLGRAGRRAAPSSAARQAARRGKQRGEASSARRWSSRTSQAAGHHEASGSSAPLGLSRCRSPPTPRDSESATGRLLPLPAAARWRYPTPGLAGTGPNIPRRISREPGRAEDRTARARVAGAGPLRPGRGLELQRHFEMKRKMLRIDSALSMRRRPPLQWPCLHLAHVCTYLPIWQS